jgi:tartrate dehydrogenase/decarboxylase/D-malate dehydrogenase
MWRHEIAVIPGDGIGREVVPCAQAVLDEAAARQGIAVEWREFPWSCEHYRRHGEMMPADGVERLRAFDAILLGAVGAPEIPDHTSLWGLLIPLRRGLQQYVNLRPVRLLPGVESPLRSLVGGFDVVVVRENVEGEYSEIGGRLYRGTNDEMAVQESVFTRRGTLRVLRYAFELAGRRRGRVTSATKSNGIVHTMPFWDELVDEVAAEHPGVAVESCHLDALVARLVLEPGDFDVVVASNLFGDVLSDLTAALAGSIGIAPSANLDPTGANPSMFEPIHGSAPDIAGRGVANPLGAIWSAALMLENLGHPEAAAEILDAITTVLAAGLRTPDIGGQATTAAVTDAVVDSLREQPPVEQDERQHA